MSRMTVSLEQYQHAEREVSLREAAIGLRVHTFVTLVLWAVLIPLNIAVANEFPWSVFVVAGTGIGLFFHWFGYRRAETDARRRQERIEARAGNSATA